MTRKEYEKRVERLGRIAAGLALLLFVWYASVIGSSVFRMAQNGLFREIPAALLLSSALMLAGTAVIVVLALRLVLSLRKGASPFTIRNADRLRVIGWLLIAYELVITLISRLSGGQTFEAAEGAAVRVQSHTSLGGLLIVVGLAVLAISWVFRYGVELQQLSDETL